jgi:asparagine synthase (glutamine-hydrolysing)
MCGICGYISRNGLSQGQQTVESMCNTLAHRGPDQVGWKVDPQVGMGFVRLAIIDLTSAGNQPMGDESGRYWITFNGEVFNYIGLKKELEKRGHRFLSTSDTEVVLKAYMEWGEECFHRFRGMWGLVIRDKIKNVLIASRDYFGIKPLYFYQTPEALFWSSEIKAFKHTEWPLQEDTASSLDYLEYGLMDHTERTFFKHVSQLRPGQIATITTDMQMTKRYFWRLADAINCPSETDSEKIEVDRFRSILLDSVNIGLRSDVPVWTLLSGGVDSSALVSIIHHLYPDQPVNALSVVHDDPQINEFSHAEAVAREKGCHLEVVRIDNTGWLDALENMIYHQDEPCESTTFVNHWYLMRELKKRGIKVILSGQGVDEILYGYVNLFMGYFFADLLFKGKFSQLYQEIGAHWDLLVHECQLPIKAFILQAGKGLVSQTVAKRFKAGMLSGASSLLREEYKSSHDERESFFTDTVSQFDRLHNAFYRMLTVESIPRILHYEDRNSMAHSVEERVPFLDRDIVSYLFALPASYKVRNGRSKWIFREALKGILPEVQRTRRTKLGFNTPEAAWIASKEFTAYVKNQNVEETLKHSPVNLKKFQKLNAAFQATQAYQPVLWRVYNYALWKRTFGMQ